MPLCHWTSPKSLTVAGSYNCVMAPRRGSLPPNKKFTRPIEIAEIKRLRATGLSTNRIGTEIGCHKATVKRVLIENGVPLGFFRPGPELTTAAIELYARMSGVEAARLCNTTPTTIYERLRKAGIERRSGTEYAQGTDCNHEYFDMIDTAEKAYWLYFLNADGCVTERGELVLALMASDAHHVEKFRQAIGAISANVSVDERPKRKVIHGKVSWTKQARLTITSPRMAQALAGYGVIPKKTGRTVMPTGVPDRLISHGWRGAVDGDGWIALAKGSGKRRPQAMIGFTGDRPVVESWQEFCLKYVPTKASIQPNHSVWKFTVTDSFAIGIGGVLYRDASLFLERKREQFERILDAYRQRTDRWGNPSKVARMIGLDRGDDAKHT